MASNVERRTWDKKAYEARAKARSNNDPSSSSSYYAPSEQEQSGDKRKQLPSALQQLHDEDDDGNKEEFQPAEAGRAGPAKSQRAFLKARKNKVDLTSKLGTTEIINPDAVSNSGGNKEDGCVAITDGITKSSTGVGWHCRVCDCFLKDSLTYLDHINGRKHQRHLGFSMRAEKSSTSDVSNKLAILAKKKRDEEEQRSFSVGFNKKSDGSGKRENEEDPLKDENEFDAIVRRKDEEALKKKAERARRKEERKKKEREEAQEECGIDPEMAAMMGFGGFGGGSANR
uniref:U1-type domain-containing protein n=1 Tax=Ditylum brightwellii TaxID=49249 RepID=A0A7S1YTZ5_9STRA|mmetsp:Transcript_17407/g.25901  ORF Transcript_17407/g.25901 Transcript_17407/m.25901 type:complete len:286 (+) Transcript_17407:50-907(+)